MTIFFTLTTGSIEGYKDHTDIVIAIKKIPKFRVLIEIKRNDKI